MRTHTPNQDHAKKPACSDVTSSQNVAAGQRRRADSVSPLQRTTGNQAGHPVVQDHADGRGAGLSGRSTPHLAHDFSRIPVHSPTGQTIQTKLTINTPGDKYEREADRVADEVMRMPAETGPVSLAMKPMPNQDSGGTQWEAPPIVHDVLRSPGRPLDANERRFMEARFGHDFSGVRIHHGRDAHRASRAINARAFTIGSNIGFAYGTYRPRTVEGKKLLAHELTHTIQQTDSTTVYRQEEGDPVTNELNIELLRRLGWDNSGPVNQRLLSDANKLLAIYEKIVIDEAVSLYLMVEWMVSRAKPVSDHLGNWQISWPSQTPTGPVLWQEVATAFASEVITSGIQELIFTASYKSVQIKNVPIFGYAFVLMDYLRDQRFRQVEAILNRGGPRTKAERETISEWRLRLRMAILHELDSQVRGDVHLVYGLGRERYRAFVDLSKRLERAIQDELKNSDAYDPKSELPQLRAQ